MAKNQIVIAAISSRVYVQAAVDAGFEVIAIDAFADIDTQAMASQIFKVPVEDGQFDGIKLLAILQQLDLSQCLGLCYGAGFETQPNLLVSIQQFIPVIGNSAIVVEQTKTPALFFDLCDRLNMTHPVTQLERPIETKNWLQKKIGGNGGTHIKQLLPISLPLCLSSQSTHYYQKIQIGMPVSCLFLADGVNAQVIGFNEQWCASTTFLPYRYAGAVSNVVLENRVKHKLEDFIQSATKELHLLGLNSCDCLIENGSVFMLEINPRLSATLGLYRAKKGNLFAAHIDACLKRLNQWPTLEKQSRAHYIVYANKLAHVPIEMDWPAWVRDIPLPHSIIKVDEPICSVVANALTAKLAKKRVLQRMADL